MYAVTHSTGPRAVQFDRAKNVQLTESLDIYLSSSFPPQTIQTPERPTYIKDVSLAGISPIAALAMAQLV